MLKASQIVVLAATVFFAVISRPRQMLLEITVPEIIPVEFRIVALSVPDFFVIALLLLTAIRLAVEVPYRITFSQTVTLVVNKTGGVIWLALLVWLLVSQFWALEPVMARWIALHYAMVLIMALVLVDVVRQGDERPLLWALVISGVIQSLIAVAQTVNNGPLGLWGLGEIERFWYEPTTYYRSPGLAMHANYLGGYLMLALFGVILLFNRARQSGQRAWVLALAGLVICIGIIATLSRSAMLGTAVGLAPLILLLLAGLDARRRRVALAGLGALAVAGALWGAVVLAGDFETRILAGREFFFDDTFAIIERYPIQGAGAGNLMIEVAQAPLFEAPETLPVHNVYLYIWGEAGLVGMALFILGCAWMLLPLRRPALSDIFIWTCGFLAVCVIMVFDNYFWAVHPFRVVFFWIMGLGWAYHIQQIAQPEDEAAVAIEPIRVDTA